MGKSEQLSLRVAGLVLGVFTSLTVYAVDLVPFDASPIRVSACSHQVRFQVKLLAGNNERGADNIRASYRIGIYSSLSKAPLTTFSVSEQKVNETFNFVVPSDLLSCVNSITIVVNDKKNFREANQSNNVLKVSWKRHDNTFGSSCADQQDSCAK